MIHISENKSLPLGWLRVLRALRESKASEETVAFQYEAPPAELSTSDKTIDDNFLAQWLESNKLNQVRTVAGTIFPKSLWNPKSPRDQLFSRFRFTLPRILRHPANRRGTYFQRLVSHGNKDGTGVNQLEFILSAWESGIRRRSAFQCTTFDPNQDLKAQPRLGFPCLQQVAFVPLPGKRLGVSAFYATQYLLGRALGNYVGLWDLGEFMAHEMGLTMSQLHCFASIGLLDDGIPRKNIDDLLNNFGV